MKSALTLGALALGTAMVTAPAANALGVIFSQTYEYGKKSGQRDPGGSDKLGNGYVRVSDKSKTRFNDVFDFSGFDYASVDRFDLTLTFQGAGPKLFRPEGWFVRVQGSDSSSSSDDFFQLISDPDETVMISLGTDVWGIDAFAHTLATSKYEFWFSEFTKKTDKFYLKSAKLDIVGVVPLPAAAWMLGGVAGLGLIAGRRKPKA